MKDEERLKLLTHCGICGVKLRREYLLERPTMDTDLVYMHCVKCRARYWGERPRRIRKVTQNAEE